MKKITSKITLSAITALSFPKEIIATGQSVPINEITVAGNMPTTTDIFDRLLGWALYPLGIIALLFYSIYFMIKIKKKKKKKAYLYIANVFLVLIVLIILFRLLILENL